MREKLELCKLLAKKEERLGRERKKDNGRGFNVFGITRFSETEIPIGWLLVNRSKILSTKKVSVSTFRTSLLEMGDRKDVLKRVCKEKLGRKNS